MTDPQGDDTERRHNVNETAHPLRASTQVKRGGDVRDQDTIDVKARGDEPDDVIDDLNAMVERIRETADVARSIQPDQEPLSVHEISHEAFSIVDQRGESVLKFYIGDDAELHVEGDGGDLVEVPDGG